MDRKTNRQLSHLAALSAASSLGYAVASENVRNRGLKIIFQSYARQRAEITDQLHGEITRLGGKSGSHRNPLAALHRGWINLKATMAIGAENTESIVLDEVARGERRAGKDFQAALLIEASEETRELLERCTQQVQAAQEHIDLLRGADNHQMVVRLVDQDEDVGRAVAELRAAGFSDEQITISPADQLKHSAGKVVARSTVRETVATTALLSGFGGALLGIIMAILSLATQQFDASTQTIAVITAVGWPFVGALVGALFGAIIGGMLGQGISEQDTYFTSDSIQHGETLVMVECMPARARQASEIMYRVNVAARSSRQTVVTTAPTTAA